MACCILPSELPWELLKPILHGWGKGHDESGWSSSVRPSGWKACGLHFLTKMWQQIVFYTWPPLSEIWMYCVPKQIQTLSRVHLKPAHSYPDETFRYWSLKKKKNWSHWKKKTLLAFRVVMRHFGSKSAWLKSTVPISIKVATHSFVLIVSMWLAMFEWQKTNKQTKNTSGVALSVNTIIFKITNKLVSGLLVFVILIIVKLVHLGIFLCHHILLHPFGRKYPW